MESPRPCRSGFLPFSAKFVAVTFGNDPILRQAWFFQPKELTNYRSTLGSLSLTRGDPTRSRWNQGVVRKLFWSEKGLCRLTVALAERKLGVELEWSSGDCPLSEAQLRALLGFLDEQRLTLDPEDPLLRLPSKARRLRMSRVPWFQESVLQTILHQRVSGAEAGKNWGRLCRRFGQTWDDLVSAPSPKRLLSLSSAEFAACGIEAHRRVPLKEAAFRLPLLTEPELPLDRLEERMLGCHRIGEWTSAYVRGHFLGDPDAVPLGDYNLPHLVGYVFRGVRRSSDQEMLQDLEPYRGHRFRVLRWLGAAGITIPRRGPRMVLGKGLG